MSYAMPCKHLNWGCLSLHHHVISGVLKNMSQLNCSIRFEFVFPANYNSSSLYRHVSRKLSLSYPRNILFSERFVVSGCDNGSVEFARKGKKCQRRKSNRKFLRLKFTTMILLLL